MRYSRCYPVDPTDRPWVPKYDLDDPRINPEVRDLLSYYIPIFIDIYLRQQTRTELKPVIGRATNELLRVFDFNRHFKYDFAAFAHEIRVRQSFKEIHTGS
jgi:hypothetical protein